MPEPVDFVGKPITVGCDVVYPVRRGKDMWLNRMKVQMIDQNDEGFGLIGYSPAGRKVRVKNTHNCVVI